MSDKKPNLIWIMTDQQPAYMLSCNDDPNVHTPNIDYMGKVGVNFRNAVGGFPLCCPFRGSMLTSVYPHKCVPGHQYQLPPEMPTVAQPFRQAGYHTAYIGKWHLDGFKETLTERAAMHIVPPERRGGFDYWVGYENNNSQFDTWVHGGEGENAFQYRLPGYETDSLTDLLLDYIDKQSDEQPFFAVMSVQPPHDPYIAPAQYASRFNPQQLEIRPDVPHVDRVEKLARQELAGAYAMVENMDDNVGRIIQKLQDKDMLDNTYLIYFSDHGDMHGSHGQFRKMTAYQESVNIPFVVMGAPNIYGHRFGSVPYPINHVDIAPTSLGLCGIPVPDWMEGTDYSGCYTRQETAYPHSAFLQSVTPTGHGSSVDKPWRGLLTVDGWKYACFEDCTWMLYNLNEDPYEQVNLAHDPDWKGKRRELLEELAGWIQKTGDQFTLPKP